MQGSLDCWDASLDVHKAWNSHSALANPNVCSTLPFPLTPWDPFTSTAVALQRSSSTTISTRLLDGICCRLSRPWKPLVILRLLTVVREIVQESIHCPTDWGIWLSWCLEFCRSPSSTQLWALPLPRQSHNSHNPHLTLWAGVGQALPHLTSVSGNKQVQAQTSAKIITGIVWSETAAHFHFSIGWKKRDNYVGLACSYFSKTVIAA